jgi:hypothetical protein
VALHDGLSMGRNVNSLIINTGGVQDFTTINSNANSGKIHGETSTVKKLNGYEV